MNNYLIETHIQELFKSALLIYIDNESQDFKERHVGERARVFRVAYYLQNLICHCPLLDNKSIVVDVEYNRDKDKPKLNYKKACIIPDLIVHVRNKTNNTRQYNYLACEFKNKYTDKKLEKDNEKLNNYKERYGYKSCVCINFNKLNKEYVENLEFE